MNMPKFDFIVQNPPYSGSLHLDFLKKGYEMLSDKGQMIIIEPATWLINLNSNSNYKTGKKGNLTPVIKKRIYGHIKKIIIENYNTQFNTGNDVPFSIAFIDNEKQYDSIIFKCCGYEKTVKNIDDCNLIGDLQIINSIFEKIKINDIVKNHIYIPNKSEKIQGNYYCKYATIITSPLHWHNISYDIAYTWDSFYLTNYFGKEYFNGFIKVCINNEMDNWIFKNVPFRRLAGGGKSKKIRYSDKEDNCITGTKEEIENWKYYIFNNSLPLFLNMCLTYDQNNNSISYVPWLVDKKYTDREIYDMFNFTDEEIKLIETTIKKFERYSVWFKRYFCGPSEVTDEEVQKFMEDLNNA